MVNTPIDNYITWARRAYPDEKTKIFPISAEKLCLYIKHTSFPIDNMPHLITYLSTHPKHGSEWSHKIRVHPTIMEHLSMKKRKRKTDHNSKAKCVVIDGKKAKGYMIVTNINEHNPDFKEHIQQPTFQVPDQESAKVFIQPRMNKERKRRLKGLSKRDNTEAEMRDLKKEIESKDKEIKRLKAILGQYQCLLSDDQEQECFVQIRLSK